MPCWMHGNAAALQFCRSGHGVEDATATLLKSIFKHLEGYKNHAKLLFVDFSSPFNNIQPHIPIEKLLNNFNLDFSVVGWILDFFNDQNRSEGKWMHDRRDVIAYWVSQRLPPLSSPLYFLYGQLSQLA